MADVTLCENGGNEIRKKREKKFAFSGSFQTFLLICRMMMGQKIKEMCHLKRESLQFHSRKEQRLKHMLNMEKPLKLVLKERNHHEAAGSKMLFFYF